MSATGLCDERIEAWFARSGWAPFDFQRQAWSEYRRGRSGLIHAPTGVGKTLAAFLGPVLEYLDTNPCQESPERKLGDEPAAAPSGGNASPTDLRPPPRARARGSPEPIRILWLTPMRALASDTLLALQQAATELCLPWSIEKRTGDTPGSLKKKQRDRLPTCLVTTPESLSLLLSYPECRERFATLRCIVVDEWHELIGTKRGVQTELCLARLRTLAPGVRTWGVSATIGNLDQAAQVLLGPAGEPEIVRADVRKHIEIRTLIPEAIERFPWAGHLGIRVLPQVLEVVGEGENQPPGATLIFTNTRSQAEIWFKRILDEQPSLLGGVAIHHGSLDRDLRAEVELLLADDRLRCVVCTSSLDLGVDFSPVDRIIQVGSPRGVARLLQRAGRSGHRPGAISRIFGAPTHALELVEFAAVRDAAAAGRIEGRPPLQRCLDVLVQHLVTVAAGGGFIEHHLRDEVRSTWAFRDLSDREWSWCMDFTRRGGECLRVYPQYARVVPEEEVPRRGAEPDAESAELCNGALAAFSAPSASSSAPLRETKRASSEPPRWVIASESLARTHRLGIGTISSDIAMQVRLIRGSGRTSGGASIGTIEESFIARLAVGDRFIFSGRMLELVKVRGMTVYARVAQRKSGVVPKWGGGRFPLSTQLAAAVREKIEQARRGNYDGTEMQAVRPVLELQRAWSIIPAPDELLVETLRTPDGDHIFVFPFDGRSVHEGLGALLAYRLTQLHPRSITATANDYGFELLCPEPLDVDETILRSLLAETSAPGHDLLTDLACCLNSNQMARRQFRDIARIAGLIIPTYPGSSNGRPMRHVQASSDMFFDVFQQFDPGNLLLEQARREVLQDQLELSRLRDTMARLARMRIIIKRLDQLTPLSFPLWAEHLREVHTSSESWSAKIAKMAVRLEEQAQRQQRTRTRRTKTGAAAVTSPPVKVRGKERARAAD